MRHPSFILAKVTAPVLLAACLLLAGPSFATESKGSVSELKKLRVLLVIDSGSNLSNSVARDRANLEKTLRNAIPRDHLDIKVIDGKGVTRDAILETIRGLKTGPTEALLFYYAGHGKIDENNGQSLCLQQGRVAGLPRAEVRRALERKKAGLVVLLTDCCSTKENRRSCVTTGKKRDLDKEPMDRGIHDQVAPMLRYLFFQHRGVADITAAQDGTASYCDNNGGVFTRALCKLLRSSGKDRGRFVTWKDFADKLSHQTQKEYDALCEMTRTRDKVNLKEEQATQKPRVFSLPERRTK
jgi:Caspase domain